jgi:hypothetical protein
MSASRKARRARDEIECYTHQPAMKGEIVVLPQ